ncbi:M1 family aminopeptidase [Flavobacterium sp. SUN046]|uniref:M1 family aminopeptidase n=1 Tax=Flavobacterium sp. SUN046 TaxID=3002440 RepID=UPI002DBE5161|nr:M1 family aminopeptidase [Flavobacterium sp. SUN046]MEC4050803.1 M1 family aminopeptidase [Flavobacterium sp. SUN046]
MKIKYFLLLLSIISLSFAQEKSHNHQDLVGAERKAAAKIVNFQVNPNTQNYDITYHRLEFTVDPADYWIAGKVTTTYTALSNMSSITFDLSSSLEVSAVRQNNADLVFTQNSNDELIVTLPGIQTQGTSASVEITYAGSPPSNGFGSFSTDVHSGAPILWTLSEPYGARDWWPCKQDLNDKVNSIDVYITAPSQYVAVSNGLEAEPQIVTGSSRTTHFHHGYPIPAYLIAIAVSNYSVYNQTSGTGANQFPIINYVFPETFSSIQAELDQTPLLLDLYANLFEIYPFHNEKYGHAQFGWGGGMEHTTVSFMVGFDRQLIAHEMAHQWFGDKITCGSWKDIWLNEGFATYVASMVYENFDSLADFIADKSYMVSNVTSNPNGAVYLSDAEVNDVNRIFDGRLTYNKGAMVLEMLRFKLGDALFFQGIKNYLADVNLAYKYAVTSDFKSHMEAVYGSSLTEFFNDWIYNQGYPSYTITAQNWGTGQARFVVNQTQSNASVSYFEMPVPVRIHGAGGLQQDIVLDNTSNGQVIIQSVPFPITSVEFDPEVHLISRNNNITLGNAAFELDEAIVLYPNPVANELHIQMPTSVSLEKVTVYNSLGQKVMQSNGLNFSVSSLSTGVHFVDIETSEGTFHKKIIKK